MLELVKTAYAQAVNTEFGPATNIGDYISLVMGRVLPLLGGIALLMMIYAGYLYMTSQGNTDQINKAKDIIIGVLVGIVLIFSIEFIVGQVIGVR